MAHTEARSVRNGIGLVKLMGRHSGFIACSAALAANEVNFVLIPEVPFTLEDENGFLHALHRRIQQTGHASIVVAEGAGQQWFDATRETDVSGNAAMAGKTGTVIGCWHGHYVHVPIGLAVSARKQVDPGGDLWHSVIESTGQPPGLFN